MTRLLGSNVFESAFAPAGGTGGGGGSGTVTHSTGALTAKALLVGAGGDDIKALAAATHGQIPIGSTGADPVITTITGGTGITVTNGAGSITVTNTGVTGSGTANTLPKFSAGTVLANSLISESGSAVVIGDELYFGGSAAGNIQLRDNSGTLEFYNGLFTNSASIKVRTIVFSDDAFAALRMAITPASQTIEVVSGTQILWSNNATSYNSGSKDVGIKRAGAKIIEVTDGSTGKGYFAGQHYIGTGTAPAISAGAGAGTSPTVTISGTDAGGKITITTGTSAASGVLATITFNAAFGSAPFVILAAGDTDSAGKDFYVGTITTTTFELSVKTALADSTEYIFYYKVVQ